MTRSARSLVFLLGAELALAAPAAALREPAAPEKRAEVLTGLEERLTEPGEVIESDPVLLERMSRGESAEKEQALGALRRKYLDLSRVWARDFYHEAKFLSEALAGVPFPDDLELEDFTQAAAAASLELTQRIGRSPPENPIYLSNQYTGQVQRALSYLLSPRWGMGRVEIAAALSDLRQAVEKPDRRFAQKPVLTPAEVAGQIPRRSPVWEVVEQIRRGERVSLERDPRVQVRRVARRLPAEEDPAWLRTAAEERPEVLELILREANLTPMNRQVARLHFGVGQEAPMPRDRMAKFFKDLSEEEVEEKLDAAVRQVLRQSLRSFDPDTREVVTRLYALGKVRRRRTLEETAQEVGRPRFRVTALAEAAAKRAVEQAFDRFDLRTQHLLRLRYGLPYRRKHTREEIAQIFGKDYKAPATMLSEITRKLGDASQPARVQAALRDLREVMLEQGAGTGSLRETAVPAGFEPGSWIRPEVPWRAEPLSEAEEEEILAALRELTPFQQRILPHVLEGADDEELMRRSGSSSADWISEERRRILGKLRPGLTFGLFDPFGPPEQVQATFARLATESRLERLFRRARIDRLLVISRGDKDLLEELLLQLYPGEFKEQEIRQVVEGHFQQIASRVRRTRAARIRPGQVLGPVRRLVRGLRVSRRLQEEQRRRVVLRRLLRDLYYPLIRQDEESGTREGLAALARELERVQAVEEPLWREVVQWVHDFYQRLIPYQPEGFRAEADGVTEPLLPAQRFGVGEGVRLLESPTRGVLLTSEARVGKTIMAVLAAYNLRKPDGTHPRRVLYTTSKPALYEVKREVERRTDLGIRVFVVDAEEGDRQEQIEEAAGQPGNVLLIINYDAVGDLPGPVRSFGSEVNIIDEIDTLRHADETQQGPVIFGIPAEYRIGISARLFVKDPRDLVEPLLWIKGYEFPSAEEGRAHLRGLTPDGLLVELDSVTIRWRRTVVLPELGEPIETIERLPYTPQQARVIREMRRNFPRWRSRKARPELRSQAQGFFSRHSLELKASFNLAAVLPNAQMLVHVGPREPYPLEADVREVEVAGVRYRKEIVYQPEGRILVRLRPIGGGRAISIPVQPGYTNVLVGGDLWGVAQFQDLTDLSPKVQRLNHIIDEERQRHGKVLVMTNFVDEEVQMLEEYYQRRLGAGAALGVHGRKTLRQRSDAIWRFRSEPEPVVLIGTYHQLAASLNLTHLPGRSFHNSTVVRFSRAWINYSDGERLIAIGRDAQRDPPVRVITLESVFADPQMDEAGKPERSVDEMLDQRLAGQLRLATRTLDGRPVLSGETLADLDTMVGEVVAAADAQEVGPAEALGSGLEEGRQPRSIPIYAQPAAQEMRPLRVYVGLSGAKGELVERNLFGAPGAIQLVDRLDAKVDVLIADARFDPEALDRFLASGRGTVLEVGSLPAAARLTPGFLFNLAREGLLRPGRVLAVDWTRGGQRDELLVTAA